MEGCPIVIRGTADGFEKEISMPSVVPWTGSRTGPGQQYPNWCSLRINAIHHIICPGHARHRGLAYGNISSALTEKR